MEWLELVGALGAGGAVGGGLVYLVVRHFLPSYLSEKAKNLATKEDIGVITETVETIKGEHAKMLEELRSGHQAKLAAVEREKTVKKEVYMEVAEAITRSQNMISAFANLELSNEAIMSPMALDAGKIAKVQVVGTAQTVRAVTAFMSGIGETTLELMLERNRLLGQQSEIESLRDMQKKAQAEIDRYLELMKRLNLDGNQDARIWDVINRSVEFHVGERDGYQDGIDQLADIQQKDHLEFAKLCMKRFFEVSALLPDAVISVREELDLVIDRDEYTKLFNENLKRGEKVFEGFLDKLSKPEAVGDQA